MYISKGVNPFSNVFAFELDWKYPKKSIDTYIKQQFPNSKKREILLNEKIDIIIASDVIWVRPLIPLLVNALKYLYDNVLSLNGGAIVIGEQIRSLKTHQLFWSLFDDNIAYSKKMVLNNKLVCHSDFMSNKILCFFRTERSQ